MANRSKTSSVVEYHPLPLGVRILPLNMLAYRYLHESGTETRFPCADDRDWW